MDDWHRRDLPLLRLIAKAEREDARALNSGAVAESLALEKRDVWRGFNALRDAGCIQWSTQARYPWDRYVVVAPRLAERGRQELGLWPADGFDIFIALLDQRIQAETEPEKRSGYERLRKAARGLSREVVGELLADVIRGVAKV